MSMTQDRCHAPIDKHRVDDLLLENNHFNINTNGNNNTQYHNSTSIDNMNNYVANMARIRLSNRNTSSTRKTQKFTSKFTPLSSLITPKTTPLKIDTKSMNLNIYEDTYLPTSPLTPTQNEDDDTQRRTVSSLTRHPDGEKKEVMAGRLYLLRHVGNASQSSASPCSPSRSFTKPFNFSSLGVLSSPNTSPPSPDSPSNSTKRKLPVYVRVYRCHKDHFALVSRDSSCRSRHLYLNMRHCRVMPGATLGSFVIAGNFDSGSLMEFQTTDLSTIESWFDSLSTNTPPESPIAYAANANYKASLDKRNSGSLNSPSKSPCLPTLSEDDENKIG